ncbi:TonB-dependent siderophore receptor [Flavobacterium sp.]|uniref:TonB-dependent receptor plug domain-containing protein n=1 Tax=Flavobacterium sp. TaxID=239 RepID=UPI0025BCAC69|nr:TonB-dependent receptor [Flavobacterium sp.]MBA4153245.1 TonB-dependent receptor [Flavobacterium sp.]
MTWKNLYCWLAFLLYSFSWGQNDSIIRLNEVIVSDSQLKNFSKSQTVTILNDSILNKNQGSLTSLLSTNSTIYFKENGAGMVSSASFRGTTAQQTAVIWNGININSQLNGQTDFNTINPTDFTNISIRTGGGSVIYGSGAIGGSIHLNSELKFNTATSHLFRLNYGSFETYGGNYQLEIGTEKWAVQASISSNSSENDYEYIVYDKKNENGEFANQSYNFSIGHKINDANFIKFYSYLFNGERHFSGTITVNSDDKYVDFNTRNMLEWILFKNKYSSKVKAAYITEEYKYYENRNSDSYTFGQVNSLFLKHDFLYSISESITINTLLDVTQSDAKGSDLLTETRTIGTGSILWKHKLSSKLDYELGIRQEVTDTYESPLLFSAGTSFALTDFYTIKANLSKNFRIPTFNDLYWQGSGNPELNPEHSLQGEIGNEFNYKSSKFVLTGFLIQLKDMIRWIPNSGGLWQPENTQNVTNYGLEAQFETKKSIDKHLFSFSTSYGYTVSENNETEKQLTYVPNHKANANLAYNYKSFTTYYQWMYTGEVFTSSDNFYKLDDFTLSNIGIDYNFGKKKTCLLGFQVLNLTNENYQNVLSRPMPGRNFKLYLTLNL